MRYCTSEICLGVRPNCSEIERIQMALTTLLGLDTSMMHKSGVYAADWNLMVYQNRAFGGEGGTGFPFSFLFAQRERLSSCHSGWGTALGPGPEFVSKL
jgi:hypothetical protein